MVRAITAAMDSMLEKHGAKHLYRIPEGLRELCTDIAREVLRSQPDDIYSFIADYVDALLITRENAKVAVKVVNNILAGSEAIISILHRTGLSIEQIAVAAPRLQKVFRDYLHAIDLYPLLDDESRDVKSRLSLQNILESTGATLQQAEKAATIIQAAFRGHYEKMRREESKGLVQWQRAVGNTLEILRKAGVSQAEATKAVTLIQAAYRGYYARRNRKLKMMGEDLEKRDTGEHILDPADTMQAVAWLDMMYEDSGLSIQQANEAACIIQNAYKKYKIRKRSYDVQRIESTKSMVAEAIVDSLRKRVFEAVISQEDIFEAYGDREDMIEGSKKLQQVYQERVGLSRISQEALVSSDRDEPYGSELKVTDGLLEEEKGTKHHLWKEEFGLEEHQAYLGGE